MVSLWPAAKFLQVIKVNGSRTLAGIGLRLDERNGFMRGRKRQAIAQGSSNGKKIESAAIFFRRMVAIQFFLLAPGAKKVVIIDHHIIYAGIDQRRHNRRFPYPLG